MTALFPCAALPERFCCERECESVYFMCVNPIWAGGLIDDECIRMQRDAEMEADRSAGPTHTHTHRQ